MRPVALTTRGSTVAGDLWTRGAISLPSDTSTPTRIVEGAWPTWYHALTPVDPSSSSGYGSDQNGPSALRPGAPCPFHTSGAMAAVVPPSE